MERVQDGGGGVLVLKEAGREIPWMNSGVLRYRLESEFIGAD